MTYRKKLIEVALPLEAINVASAREKSIRHGHPSTLHLWWARRPLAAARAVIFASLVDDPDSPDALPAFVEACRTLPYAGKNVHTNGDTPRMRLFDFIERLVQWESTTDEAVLNDARRLIMIATEGNPPPLLDPFAGGGSIPLEAQRLGLEAHASDLNPVAVMINKAQIEIPPRFANQPPVNPRDRARMSSDEGWKGAAGLAADVRYYGEWMREKAWERIGHLYPTHNGETVIAWIWARTVKSPNPAVDAYVPLVKSFALSTKKGKEAWIEPIVEPNTREITFKIHRSNENAPDGTVERNGGHCLITGVPITLDYIRDEGRDGRMKAQLMAVVTEGRNGRNYHSPSIEQEQIAQVSIPEGIPSTYLPEQALGFRVQRYGMGKHSDLFTARQLTALTTFVGVLADVQEKISVDASDSRLPADDRPLSEGGSGGLAYAQAVCIYLSFAISKGANYWSSLCAWHTSAEKMMSTFGRQALSMTWDYTEANPFSDSSGNFDLGVDQAAKFLERTSADVTPGKAFQRDVANLAEVRETIISTDPPYYDNIGYADLSDFFYVWLRKGIGTLYPDLFSTLLTPKTAELIAEPSRHPTSEAASKFFEDGLFKAFEKIHNITSMSYPASIFYAFKQSESDADDDVSSTGWETFLSGVVGGGFHILGTWPIRTEQAAGLRLVGRNALASSIVLVCRPRPEDAPTISRRQFVDALRRELPAALKEMQSGNIAPVDLAQASIGPGMAIYSRYSAVLEADGTPMAVRAALGLINQELDAHLAEQDGDLDGDTRFAVAWFEQFGFNDGDFGQADVLARAKNTSVAGVEAAGLVRAARGKVRLVHWKEYDPGAWNPQADKRPTVWEATHHLIERLNSHGEAGSALLMTTLSPEMAAGARTLAYRLYNVCERKGWAEHARDYNALVISWAEIGEQAARVREEQAQNEATQQGRLFE
jgi:putative DNA methylase